MLPCAAEGPLASGEPRPFAVEYFTSRAFTSRRFGLRIRAWPWQDSGFGLSVMLVTNSTLAELCPQENSIGRGYAKAGVRYCM